MMHENVQLNDMRNSEIESSSSLAEYTVVSVHDCGQGLSV